MTVYKRIKQIGYFMALLAITTYTFTLIYIGNRVYVDNAKNSDAVVILGARSYVDGQVNECLVARVEHGINLYNKGLADKIIMSGGTDKSPNLQNTNEALEMEKIALSLDPGIDREDILIEGKSTSTYENLLYTKEIMAQEQLNSVIIITEPFHSPRANLIANKLNIDHTVSPTLTSPCWNNWKFLSRYFLREGFATIWYKLIGQI